MRTAEAIYAWVFDAPNRPMAVAMLPDEELLRVSGLLLQHYSENDATGEILGICLVERSDRWAMRVMRTKEGDKGGEA